MREDHNVAQRLIQAGNLIQQGWQLAAQRVGLNVHISGLPPLSHIDFNYENKQAIGTLFTQLMLERGYLASKGFYASFAHQNEHLEGYLDAADEVFKLLAESIGKGTVERELRGPVAHSGFRRLT